MVVKFSKVFASYFFVCSFLLSSPFHFCNDYTPYKFYTGISLLEHGIEEFLKIDLSRVSRCDDRSEYGFYSVYGSGGLKLPFEPEKVNRNAMLFSGGKRINEQDYFSGFFVYRHDLLWKKMWVHDRNPYLGIPFLLADSTTGDFELNGIVCNFRFIRELQNVPAFVGLSVLYGVDEEIKKIFPRPQIKHRDLLVNIGGGYRFSQSSTFSMQFMYFDFQEISLTTRYDLEQNKTPVFFKIRGMDNPLVFRGQTSEERLKNQRGGFFELELSTGLVSIVGSFEKASAKIVDGGAYPIDQGRWRSVRYILGSEMFMGKKGNIHRSVYFRYHVNFQEAIHPDLNLVTYKLGREYFKAGLKIRFKCLSFNSIFDIGGFYSKLKRTDIFNGVLHYYSYFIPFGNFRVEDLSIGKIKFSLGGGFSQSVVRRKEIFSEREDWFYRKITVLENEYFSEGFSMYSLEGNISWGSYRLLVKSQWRGVSDRSRYTLRLSFGIVM